MPGALIKDEKTYERLREQGESKEKSARIANATAGSSRREVGAAVVASQLRKTDWIAKTAHRTAARRRAARRKAARRKEGKVPRQTMLSPTRARAEADPTRGEGDCGQAAVPTPEAVAAAHPSLRIGRQAAFPLLIAAGAGRCGPGAGRYVPFRAGFPFGGPSAGKN